MPATAPEPAKADKQTLQRQTIAVSGYARGARRLPELAADAIADLHVNAQVYEQIACDSEASAALLLLVYFVLADGIELAPAVSEKDPRFARAVEIKEHLDRTLQGLQRTLKETLEMILCPAMTFGHKVAEKVYEIPTDGPDAYRLVLKAIKVLRRGSTAFVVDEYMNVLGLVPTGQFIGQTLNQSAQIIPLEKFIVATFRMKDEDPRGQSIFRSIVKPWHVKQLTWPEFLAYLMRWAMPSLAAILSDDAIDELLTDSEGNVVTDPGTGNAITKSAAQVVLSALLEFRNSSAVVLPAGTTLTPIEATGEGEVFDTAMALLNKAIRKGILLQELATADAEHQTKSSTSEQMDVVELLVWSIKMWVAEDLVRRQICYPQVEYNFGEADARELTPQASLGDYDRKDWADDSTAVVALIMATVIDESGNRVNALTYSQIQSLLTQIGLPAPTEDEVAAIRAKAEERRKQQEQQQNQPPGNDKQGGNQSGKNDQQQQQQQAA